MCNKYKGFYRKYFKKLFDLVLSFSALIILLPIILIVAMLVKINLNSPIIFKQRRVGLNEKIFTLYKFRTMTDDKDENGKLLPDNLRSTKFGNMIRRMSLDELPELINILKGDMSIVGPRPLIVEYLPYYTEEERNRHSMRPGLTGLAQINGRSFISWEERFKLDNYYIQNCSFILDCKIILMTLLQVILKKDIANVAEVRSDEKGTYLYHEGKVFRRLDVERSGICAERNR